MMIRIGNQQRERDWLLTAEAGQMMLAEAKGRGERPRCMCVSPGVDMYIAARGNLHYMARMPGSADLHSEDCLSHIIPSNLYSVDTPAKILTSLLRDIPDVNALKWSDLRQSVVEAAGKVMVDGELLKDRLLVPAFFELKRANEQRDTYEQFFEDGANEGATQRRWVLGYIKEARPSTYGAMLTVKHMPGIVFWSVKEIAPRLIESTKSKELPICLLEVKKKKSGVLITDCAIHNADEPVAPSSSGKAAGHNIPKTEEEKLVVVRELLSLPASAPLGEVFSAMIDYCVAQASEK